MFYRAGYHIDHYRNSDISQVSHSIIIHLQYTDIYICICIYHSNLASVRTFILFTAPCIVWKEACRDFFWRNDVLIGHPDCLSLPTRGRRGPDQIRTRKKRVANHVYYLFTSRVVLIEPPNNMKFAPFSYFDTETMLTGKMNYNTGSSTGLTSLQTVDFVFFVVRTHRPRCFVWFPNDPIFTFALGILHVILQIPMLILHSSHAFPHTL